MSKRLCKELINRKYDILEYYNTEFSFVDLPKIIRIWKNNKYYIDFNIVEYPFKRPFITGSNIFNISHNLYANAIVNFKLNNYINLQSNNISVDFCLYCNSILSCDYDWTPRYMFYHIFKQLEQINCLLSSAIKLNILKRNILFIPEDVFLYIFPFLTPNIDDIFNIKLDETNRLKIL